MGVAPKRGRAVGRRGGGVKERALVLAQIRVTNLFDALSPQRRIVNMMSYEIGEQEP
jgi:hypothetical protein